MYRKTEKEIQAFLDQPRFKNIKREHTAKDILMLQPRFQNKYISDLMSEKLWKLLSEHKKNGTCSWTFGCMDPIQITQMTPYVDTIYVSGWQCASTASSNNQPSADLASYPYDTVPNKVEQLFNAQCFHDKKQNFQNTNIDYFKPIISDFDSGHGGFSTITKLTKMFIEKGAAAVHIEDQLSSVKKCGHMGGKVLKNIQSAISNLKAIRLQADSMNSRLIIVARTDAEAAQAVDSNIDVRDHPFIIGELTYCINGKCHKLECTFPEAAKKILDEVFEDTIDTSKWLPNKYFKNKIMEMTKIDFDWDWDKCRTPEGYYKVKNSLEYCVARLRCYADYADMLWCETSKPNLKEATKIASVLKTHPEKFLCYNLSPSFNWTKAGMSDNELRTFISELGKLGFSWAFITLAGFHLNGLATKLFAEKFQKEEMLAYVRDIQSKQIEHKMEMVKHNLWSGTAITDFVTKIATSNKTCTSANGKNSTENQFDK